MTEEQKGKLVDRFLCWILPKSVCSDLCVTDPNYPHPRIGTNLLTADEAKQMVEHLFETEEISLLFERLSKLEKAINDIDQTLRVPAAEYVPAIGDVFTIIDKVNGK